MSMTIRALSGRLLLAGCMAVAAANAVKTATPLILHQVSAGREQSKRNRIVYIQLVRFKDISRQRTEDLLRNAVRTFGQMREVKSATAGLAIGDSSQLYDYALIMEFDNQDDLTAFANSDTHRDWVAGNNVVPLIQNHLMVTIQPLP